MKMNIVNIIYQVILITVLVSFFIFYMIVGGSAGIGYCEGGQYFVGNHGDYTEVSRTVWIISYVLEALFFITIAIIPIGSILFSKIRENIKRKR